MSEETIGEVPEVPKRPRKTLIAILLIAIVGVAAVSVIIWWYTQKAPSPVNLVWEKKYGGSEGDEAWHIVRSGDEGFIVAGWTASFDAEGDAYLLKIDADGNKVWEKTYGGSEDDWATCIVQSGDGGFIVAGTTASFDAEGDAYLLKIDGNGDKVWEKKYGGSEGDEAWHIVRSGDEGFIVAGWTASFDAEGDAYLLKIDADGNKVWEKTYGGSEDDWATCIVQSGDGGLIVAGGTRSFGAGLTDVYLLKIDGDGNKVWEKTYGGNNKDEAYSIVESGDGGFIVGASTRPEFEDVYLLKIDGDGNKIWEKTCGGTTGSDYCYDIVQCGDGGFIVVGNTYSFGAGGGDVYLLKIDGDGEMVWQKAYGGSEYDEGSSIVECGDGEFIVAGASHGDFYLLKIRVLN